MQKSFPPYKCAGLNLFVSVAMDHNEQERAYQKAVDAIRSNALGEKSDDELAQMQTILFDRHRQDVFSSPAAPLIEIITNEISRRKLSKPHWTLTPTFWISLAILVVALLAWLFPRTPQTPNGKPVISATNFAPAPTSSPPATITTQQTSPPAILQPQNTNHVGK